MASSSLRLKPLTQEYLDKYKKMYGGNELRKQKPVFDRTIEVQSLEETINNDRSMSQEEKQLALDALHVEYAREQRKGPLEQQTLNWVEDKYDVKQRAIKYYDEQLPGQQPNPTLAKLLEIASSLSSYQPEQKQQEQQQSIIARAQNWFHRREAKEQPQELEREPERKHMRSYDDRDEIARDFDNIKVDGVFYLSRKKDDKIFDKFMSRELTSKQPIEIVFVTYYPALKKYYTSGRQRYFVKRNYDVTDTDVKTRFSKIMHIRDVQTVQDDNKKYMVITKDMHVYYNHVPNNFGDYENDLGLNSIFKN